MYVHACGGGPVNHLCESSKDISYVNHLCEKLLCLLASVFDLLRSLSQPDNVYYACSVVEIAAMPPKKRPRTERLGGYHQAERALNAGLLGAPPMTPSGMNDAVSSALVELLAFEILWDSCHLKSHNGIAQRQ